MSFFFFYFKTNFWIQKKKVHFRGLFFHFFFFCFSLRIFFSLLSKYILFFRQHSFDSFLRNCSFSNCKEMKSVTRISTRLKGREKKISLSMGVILIGECVCAYPGYVFVWRARTLLKLWWLELENKNATRN